MAGGHRRQPSPTWIQQVRLRLRDWFGRPATRSIVAGDKRRSILQYSPLEPRQLLAGDVSVRLMGDQLWVRGDHAANELSLTREDSAITLTGNSTTINGQGTSYRHVGPVENVRILLGDGDDILRVDQLDVPQRLLVDGGRGADRIAIDGVVANDARIIGGAGNDTVQISTLETHERIEIRGGRGDDWIAAEYLFAGDRIQIRGDQGDDHLSLGILNSPGRVDLHAGSGADEVLVARRLLSDRARIDLGAGDDWLSVLPARNGQTATVSDQFHVNAGSGDDTVVLDEGLQVPERTTLIGGGGRQDRLENSVDGATRDRAFEGDEVEDLNGELNSFLADLEDAGIDPIPFGAIRLQVDPETQYVTTSDPSPTISVIWDRAAQQAVVETRVGPTIASRAYGLVHTAMYDAWSAYDEPAVSTQLGDALQRPSAENVDAHKQHAMSFAAYRVLVDLFPAQQPELRSLMESLGYNAANETTDSSTPAGIGNRMAAALLASRHADGSNQLGDDPAGTLGVPYSSTVDYTSVNSADQVVVPDRWTPERVPIDASPEDAVRVQNFLTPHWGDVERFGGGTIASLRPPSPEPFLLVENATLDWENGTVQIDGELPVELSRDLIGTVINPEFIAQAEEVVAYSAGLTDRQKLVAEFWEDAGGTSFPPGTWMTFGQFNSARDNHSLDQDARMFLALGNAVMDAGIATWEAKRFYDYTRPVRAVRELGRWGLIGEFDASLNGYAIDAWVEGSGTTRILATDFLTYQTPGSDPSPPFAEFTSGHSAFSAAGAQILRQFTDSDTFGASVSFDPGDSRFEPGTTPAVRTTLAWDTYTAAAEEAGISRLYGGIHFSQGNEFGLALGREAGQRVWEMARGLINGTAQSG